MGIYCTSVCESKDPSVAGRVAHTERASHLTSEHSVLRFVRSVQTVRVANGPYSEYMQSVHFIMTSEHSVLSVRTVRTIRTNRNGPYA